MGWRERATAAPTTGGWRSRATAASGGPISQEPGDLVPQGETPAALAGDWRDAVLGPLATYVNGTLKGGADEAMGELAEKFGRQGPRGMAPEKGKAMRMPDGSMRPLETKQDVYRAARDFTRMEEGGFKEAHPYLHFGLSAAGDLTSDAALAGGKLLGAGYQAATGALTGLLGSDAELTDDKRTSGDVAQAGLSTGLGGALGFLVPAAGEKISKGVANSALGKWLGDKSRTAAADAAAEVAAKAAKAQRQATAGLGGEAGAFLGVVEKAKTILADPHAQAEAKTWAQSFLESPDTRVAIDRAYENVQKAAPFRMGSMKSAEAAMETARQGTTQEAIEAATDEALGSPLGRAVRFAKNYASRAIPVAVGSAIGGPGGAVVGSALGASLGNPGTAASNLVRNPAMRKFAADAALGVLSKTPAAVSPLAPLLLRYLQREPTNTPDTERQRAIAQALREDSNL